jgi:hypothetical protein
MHTTQQKILAVFKNKGSEISTSDILSYVDSEARDLQKKLKDAESGKEHVEHAKLLEYKRQLAKKHRKLLHHINKLVKKGILRFLKFSSKGQKFFVLNIDEDEEIVAEVDEKNSQDVYKRRILISKPLMPAMPIEGYEQKELLLKFEPATFIDRLNSIIIFSKKFPNLDELYNAVTSLFSCVNDTICLESFDYFFHETPLEPLVDFIEKLNKECEDYGKKASIIIDLHKTKDKNLLLDFLSLYEKKKLENIYIFFDLNTNVIDMNIDIFKKIIDIFSRSKASLFIKNKDVQLTPYFVGRSGPYCLDKKEWQFYSEELKNNKILACSQSSVIVDVNRILKEYGQDTKKFDEFLLNVAKALLAANTSQRRKAEDYFKALIEINKPFEPEFLVLSRNYIRFWNYNIANERETEFLLTLLAHSKKKIDSFCHGEETIYKSCGMPTRFKVAFACAFKEASEKLSKEIYDKTEVKKFDDLQKKEIKKILSIRESICNIFDGGDRVGIYKTEKINPDEIVKEIIFLLQNYKIPLLSYNFKGIGNLKLTTFFRV